MARSYGRGCAVQLIGSIIGLFIVVPCLGVTLLLANTMPMDGPWMWVLMVGAPAALLGTLLGLGLAFGLWNRRRIARMADEGLSPLALEASPLGVIGRQYHGVVEGRRVDATLNRGPRFDLYVEASAHTRLGVGTPNALSRRAAAAFETSEVTSEALAEAGLSVHARDAKWTAALLARSDVVEALIRLGRSENLAWVRSVTVQPDAVHLLLHRVQVDDITAERVRAWHADLHRLAEAIAEQPAPDDPIGANSLERLIRTEPDSVFRWGLWIGLGVVALVTVAAVCAGGLGVLLAMSTG